MDKKTLILLLCLSACRPMPQQARVQWLSMGTSAALQGYAPRAMEAAQADVRSTFEELEAELSHWQPESRLMRINRAAGSEQRHDISADFAAVLNAALNFSELSGGAFNPLIGPIMRCWGFGADAPPDIPSAPRLQALLKLADWRAIQLQTNLCGQTTCYTLRLPQAGMSLDLGAIAKGFAVDRAWQKLHAQGYDHTLIDLGGNLRALGAPPGKVQGWRTGIRDPFGQRLLGYFTLPPGMATATSGSYERNVTIGGERFSHIIDGRTARPVSGMAGVTVMAPDATLADGLSTTLFILTPEEGSALLQRFPACGAIWIPASAREDHTLLCVNLPTIVLTPPYKLKEITCNHR